jgi:hypothetical protein
MERSSVLAGSHLPMMKFLSSAQARGRNGLNETMSSVAHGRSCQSALKEDPTMRGRSNRTVAAMHPKMPTPVGRVWRRRRLLAVWLGFRQIEFGPFK